MHETLLLGRAWWGSVNPYGQPDRKISGFFLTTLHLELLEFHWVQKGLDLLMKWHFEDPGGPEIDQ